MPAPRELALQKLKLAERNPRTITPARLEQLKRALEADREMLQARPVIALPDGTVVAGNMRVRAALELGWKTIPTVTVDLDPERARLWMLRDNQGYGEWDEPVLAELLAELAAEGADLDLAGFGERELVAFMASVGGSTDPDDVPEASDEPRSTSGGVYELGPHRVMCGDSTALDQMETLLDGVGLAALVLADPPYNVSYAGGTHGSKGNIKRKRDDAYEDAFSDYSGWLAAVLTNASVVSDPAACLLLWHSTSQLRAIFAAVDAAKWEDRSFIVWNKGSIQGGLGQASKQYRTQFEPMLHCHKKGRTPRWFGPGNESDIWDVVGPRRNPLHPTMKPVELYERQIANHSEPGDVVLECFGGSGTALMAAETTGRRAFVMESEPRFADVIRQRYADYTNQPDLAP